MNLNAAIYNINLLIKVFFQSGLSNLCFMDTDLMTTVLCITVRKVEV